MNMTVKNNDSIIANNNTKNINNIIIPSGNLSFFSDLPSDNKVKLPTTDSSDVKSNSIKHVKTMSINSTSTSSSNQTQEEIINNFSNKDNTDKRGEDLIQNIVNVNNENINKLQLNLNFDEEYTELNNYNINSPTNRKRANTNSGILSKTKSNMDINNLYRTQEKNKPKTSFNSKIKDKIFGKHNENNILKNMMIKGSNFTVRRTSFTDIFKIKSNTNKIDKSTNIFKTKELNVAQQIHLLSIDSNKSKTCKQILLLNNHKNDNETMKIHRYKCKNQIKTVHSINNLIKFSDTSNMNFTELQYIKTYITKIKIKLNMFKLTVENTNENTLLTKRLFVNKNMWDSRNINVIDDLGLKLNYLNRMTEVIMNNYDFNINKKAGSKDGKNISVIIEKFVNLIEKDMGNYFKKLNINDNNNQESKIDKINPKKIYTNIKRQNSQMNEKIELTNRNVTMKHYREQIFHLIEAFNKLTNLIIFNNENKPNELHNLKYKDINLVLKFVHRQVTMNWLVEDLSHVINDYVKSFTLCK